MGRQRKGSRNDEESNQSSTRLGSLSQKERRLQILDLTGISGRSATETTSVSDQMPRGRPRLALEESSCSSGAAQPMQPPRRRQSSHNEGRGQARAQDALAHSQSVVTTQSERDGIRTLDLVLGERYAYPPSSGSGETGEGHDDWEPLQPPSFTRDDGTKPMVLEASTGVLVEDLMSDNQFDRSGWYSAGTGPIHRNFTVRWGSEKDSEIIRRDNLMRSDDSLSTMPDPPSLHQRGHYVVPGAFRMTSGGVPREAVDDVESLIGSMSSHPIDAIQSPDESPAIVEASLVNEDYTRNDIYPPLPASAFTVSMGESADSHFYTSGTKASHIVEALPMDEIQTVKAFFSTRKVRCCLLLLAVVFLILALGTAYGVTGFSESKSSSDINATYYSDPPTSAPTTEGDLDLQYFVQVGIHDYTRAALRQPNSPQSKALSWLRNNTFLAGYDLNRRMQRFSLATFYFSTGGERRWLNSAGWLTDDDECTWFFSTDETEGGFKPCDDDNMVTRFSLVENNMRGTFPLEISFLSSLEVLEMPRNILTGFLPTSLGQMSLLRSIQLFDNYLSGTVPNEIEYASSLEILDVEFNLMAQILPETLGRLTNLKRLLLDRNLFRGNIQSEFGRLSKLETFYLFSNSFSGTIPPEIGQMSNLKSVRWEVNRLSGDIPSEIGLLENLVDMSIGNNTLSGAIPSEVGLLSQLTYCDLFNNRLSGTLPSEIGRLVNVERMYFEKNRLEGPIPSQLGNLKSISRLWIYSNELTGTLPTEFGQLSNSLTNLDVSHNVLSGEVPTQIGRLTNLESLSLEYNSLTGPIPSELGRLTRLSLLALHGNLFTGIVPPEICLLKVFGNLANVVVDCSMVTCSCCICSSDLKN